jgi:hypothetical protein
VLSGCASDPPALTPTAGAGSAEAATSPTAGEPPSTAPLGQRLIHRARQYRGNPTWLGVITGALLVVGLGFGVVGLLRHSSRES